MAASWSRCRNQGPGGTISPGWPAAIAGPPHWVDLGLVSTEIASLGAPLLPTIVVVDYVSRADSQ